MRKNKSKPSNLRNRKIDPNWRLAKLQQNWAEWDPVILRNLRYRLLCSALNGYLASFTDPAGPMPDPLVAGEFVLNYADAALLALVNRQYY